MWCATRTAFQICDTTSAQPGPLGEFLLGQPGRGPTLTQLIAEQRETFQHRLAPSEHG